MANIYTSSHDLDLDEAIIRLKQLGKLVTVTDMLATGNIECLVEILQIIDRVEIPLKMGCEGHA